MFRALDAPAIEGHCGVRAAGGVAVDHGQGRRGCGRRSCSGVKTTWMTQPLPPAREAPQSLVWAKSRGSPDRGDQQRLGAGVDQHQGPGLAGRPQLLVGEVELRRRQPALPAARSRWPRAPPARLARRRRHWSRSPGRRPGDRRRMGGRGHLEGARGAGVEEVATVVRLGEVAGDRRPQHAQGRAAGVGEDSRCAGRALGAERLGVEAQLSRSTAGRCRLRQPAPDIVVRGAKDLDPRGVERRPQQPAEGVGGRHAGWRS